jgi:hypothetical protein
MTRSSQMIESLPNPERFRLRRLSCQGHVLFTPENYAQDLQTTRLPSCTDIVDKFGEVAGPRLTGHQCGAHSFFTVNLRAIRGFGTSPAHREGTQGRRRAVRVHHLLVLRQRTNPVERLWMCLSACTAHVAGRRQERDDTTGGRNGVTRPCGLSVRREFDACCSPSRTIRLTPVLSLRGNRAKKFGPNSAHDGRIRLTDDSTGSRRELGDVVTAPPCGAPSIPRGGTSPG